MAAAVARPNSLETVAPFRRSPESPAPLPARVRGSLPPWLRGELVRTCPAVFDSSTWHARHWFDGLAMLYEFRLEAEHGVAFRSKLLETEASKDASSGRTRLASFGTPIVRSFWKRLFQPIPPLTDNTNVNVVELGGDLVTMTESATQIRVDPETLSVRGAVAYDDSLEGAIMSAHPHFDFQRGRVVNLATQLGASAVLSLYEHAPASSHREVIGSWRASEAPYVHSFGLTPTAAILVAHPLTARPASLLWSNRGFIDHFSWHPERGTRLIVLDRATGATREHVTEAFFCFHVVNAFDDGDARVLDVLAYPDAGVIDTFRVDRLAEALPELRPSLVRLTMHPREERARVTQLTDRGFEFPSTNYRRANGQDYRFAWGASNGYGARGYESSIVKVDVRSGRAWSFADGDFVYGEPVFVAEPGASEEDAGVLLSVGSGRTADVSALVVLDARTMALVAHAEVPRAIPLGFHGSFVRRS